MLRRMLALALCLFAAAHPNSLSFTRITINGSEVRHQMRVQRLSVLEVLPELDPDGDGAIQPEHLAADVDLLTAYIHDHYRMFAGEDEERLERVSVLAETEVAASIFEEQWIDLEYRLTASEPIEKLKIEVDTFYTTSPNHRDDADFLVNGQAAFAHTFWYAEPSLALDGDALPPPRTIFDWLRHGLDHIVTGYDHIAFLLALLVASTRIRSLVGIVTAFTVSHSVTLGFASMGVVDAPDRLVELVIALSIAYVAAGNLMQKGPRNLWIEAFGFGLVHGLGFAGFLSESLADEPDKLKTLVGFNLGVEVGQLSIVVVLALLLRFVPGRRETTEGDVQTTWLAPVWMRVSCSAVVCVLGLYWFVERAWLSG